MDFLFCDNAFFYFARFGIRTILLGKKDPILGTVILTDKCNLHCKHCSVNRYIISLYLFWYINFNIQDKDERNKEEYPYQAHGIQQSIILKPYFSEFFHK